jgi:hypothetical protein
MSKEKVLTPEAQYNLKYEELFSYYLNKDRNFKGMTSSIIYSNKEVEDN